MNHYLVVKTSGSSAIAVCQRCQFKVYHDDLVQDPNTKTWVCKQCCDLKDPWQIAMRNPEDITLAHPRPDEALTTDGVWWINDGGEVINWWDVIGWSR
jgi:hypothetical protein